MATLALAAVGAAVGGALLPAGVTVLGATITGATIGSQIGALAGSLIDQSLLAGSGATAPVGGPRLSDLDVTASSEGAAMPRVYGRARLAGQVIWAAALEEEIVAERSGGGKGSLFGSGPDAAGYRYYATFAVALAEGTITSVGRIWADGRELDPGTIDLRLHVGSEMQGADPAIVAREGADFAPAFRGTAYVVFERLPLAEFANRIPQLSFEVYRSVDDFEERVRGVVMIPGSGEFAYATTPVDRVSGFGQTAPVNANVHAEESDWTVSLDQLASQLPTVETVSLVVSWFGSDLRVGECRLEPRVDLAEKSTAPMTWHVAGLDRAGATVVSTVDARPAYGGTPSDASVVEAIGDLHARGYSVVYSPFILMDVPAGNTLANPYTGTPGQAAYPWRGRITCHPAAGMPGSPDKSAAAAAQIAAFVGTAAPGDFSLTGNAAAPVAYTGPAEWSFRRMILHNAWICKAAGGVDAFVLCSELRGLTTVRETASSYPFVAALAALAADVRAILGPAAKITYAADWTEYFGHQPADGTGDVYFHLDPLWASSDIDAIGIDLYWPLADWRDGPGHLDLLTGARSQYDLAHLRANVRGGEGFDWYYASPADREAQVRTPVTDGLGKPWVFRFKDLASWWSNPHYDRPGGLEAASATPWLPRSKPVWLLEIGCPAVDKGANQPNLFTDPKSSESALPHFSRGNRDDLAQRSYLRALHEAFDPAHAGYVAGSNPPSDVYPGRMLDLSRMCIYAWDARPYPAFPAAEDIWGDGANWPLGHWLNGRIAGMPIARVVARILDEHGFHDHDTSALDGIVAGYVVDRIMSARDALEALSAAYFVDAVESGPTLRFRQRGNAPRVADLTPDALVETASEAPLYRRTRAQETDLPVSAKIAHLSVENEHRRAIAEARRATAGTGRIAMADLALLFDASRALAVADTWLHEAWVSRERLTLTLPPSRMALEPGDALTLHLDGENRLYRVLRIADGAARSLEAVALDPEIYRPLDGGGRALSWVRPPARDGVDVVFLDLPSLEDTATSGAHVVAFQQRWPGPVDLLRAPEAGSFTFAARIDAPAIVGETLDPLPTGPEGRWDHATTFRVRLVSGELASASETRVLAGANLLAVEASPGLWEILQFRHATLEAPATYRLAQLLRAQGGSGAAFAALKNRTPTAARAGRQ
jgi:hypothetical protein